MNELPLARAPLRVGLVGFGKAGQAVCVEFMRATDVLVSWVVRRHTDDSVDAVESVIGRQGSGGATPLLGVDRTDMEWLLAERPVDFVVDFSGSSGCLHYADAAASAGVGIVSAVSAYRPEHLAVLRAASRRTVVLHSPNITLGINFILLAARALQKLAPYADIRLVEEHFRDKREVSGTARRMAEDLGLDPARHLSSVRVGGVVGRHEVIFGFPFQTLRLVHEAISRQAFGTGALFALRALAGRAPGFYTMEKLVAEEMASVVDGGVIA